MNYIFITCLVFQTSGGGGGDRATVDSLTYRHEVKDTATEGTKTYPFQLYPILLLQHSLLSFYDNFFTFRINICSDTLTLLSKFYYYYYQVLQIPTHPKLHQVVVFMVTSETKQPSLQCEVMCQSVQPSKGCRRHVQKEFVLNVQQ